MQRIEILKKNVTTNSGTSARTGKDYAVREQAAALHDSTKPYPVAVRLTLGKNQTPYEPGLYEINSPLSVGSFDSLQVNRDLALVAVRAPARQ